MNRCLYVRHVKLHRKSSGCRDLVLLIQFGFCLIFIRAFERHSQEDRYVSALVCLHVL